ncbi:hypothetical protein HYS48_01880 [Candidatus Woesearchaeota archaeon]|nr:hypothetical protein [Candidatus Woesearchaeota archaeon]
MNEKEFKKNRLDIEYKFEAQKAHIYLTLGTITAVSFLGVMLVQKMVLLGVWTGIAIIGYASIMYRQSQKRMQEILQAIEQL